jgi:hypothetical protein
MNKVALVMLGLQNPGFEQGTNFWTPINNPGDVTNFVTQNTAPPGPTEGKQYARVHVKNGGASIGQTVTLPDKLIVGNCYEFQIAVCQGRDNGPTRFQLKIATLQFHYHMNITNPPTWAPNSWQYYTVNMGIKAPTGNEVQVEVYINDNDGEVYLDDASLVNLGPMDCPATVY